MSYARAFITRRGLVAATSSFLIFTLIAACADGRAPPRDSAARIDSAGTRTAEIAATPAGEFDGAWKGKLLAQTPEFCKFREKHFDATVKNNEFLAIIDQEGKKREFEGTIGRDGKVNISGNWYIFDRTSNERQGVWVLNISGGFSDLGFKGKLSGNIGIRAKNTRVCSGTVYMARPAGSLKEVEMEAADPVLYGKVKALEKLVEQAGGRARPAPLAMEEDRPATKGGTETAEIEANPDAPFDGAWKGKLMAVGKEAEELCAFREKYFDATVKDNRFVAIIDQEGTKREFDGTTGNGGKLQAFGQWHISSPRYAELRPVEVRGAFSGHRFKGRFQHTNHVTRYRPSSPCRGTVYLARAPLTLAEVVAEATAVDPNLYRKVKALERLLKQAAKTGGPPSGGQAPGVGREVAAAEREELEFWDSIKGSTKVEDFQVYLGKYPDGRFAALTRSIIEQLAVLAQEREELQAWESIKDSTKAEVFQAYLAGHPEGRFAERARRSIQELAALAQEREEAQAWQSVKDSTKAEDLQGYLKTYPAGRFAVQARSRVQQLVELARERKELQAWESVKDGTRSADFQGYLKTYPDGRFAALARTRIQQLAALAREGKELRAWESVKDSKRVEDLQAYLGTYPAGRFAGAAEQRRKELLRLASIPDIDFGQYYALVIGNDEHQFLPDLKTAKEDARAVAEVLQDRYGFTVELLLNATRRDILGALGRLRRKLTENDNLLVYYAGHGVVDEATERGYWLPVDAEEDIDVNWISNSRLTDALKATDTWHALVVADSCYSGTLVRGISAPVSGGERSKLLERLAFKKSRTVLSSGGLEPVMDSGGGGHSVFAKAFLDVLGGNDEVLEAQRIFSALRSKVIANADQTPEYSDIHKAGHDGGDFLFVPSR